MHFILKSVTKYFKGSKHLLLILKLISAMNGSAIFFMPLGVNPGFDSSDTLPAIQDTTNT